MPTSNDREIFDRFGDDELAHNYRVDKARTEQPPHRA